jgi:hypothetical protein
MPYACYWLEPTHKAYVSLRRYTYHDDKPCPSTDWGHDAETRIEDEPAQIVDGILRVDDASTFASDARWPTQCTACGYAFDADDHQTVMHHLIYTRSDTGDEMLLRDATPGAVWDAPWMGVFYRGPDERCVVVMTPGHEWFVDSRAANCGSPDDKWDSPGHHYCWVRHGDPTHPETLHVDKNGHTCAAGAGSIQAGNYHGFLHNGQLTD